MKIFSGPKSPDPAGRQHAQGCLASNLALPGLGSLAGGRKVGLCQLGLGLSGFAISLGTGLHFVYWSLAHWSEYHGANAVPFEDPLQPLRDLWQQARWPLLGIGLFLCSWFWALATSRSLLAAAKMKPPVMPATAHEK
jgi:hypothetical protein